MTVNFGGFPTDCEEVHPGRNEVFRSELLHLHVGELVRIRTFVAVTDAQTTQSLLLTFRGMLVTSGICSKVVINRR